MVLVKILGLMDLLAALAYALVKYSLISQSVAAVLVLVVLVKSIIFLKDVSSMIDMAAALFLLLAIYGMLPSAAIFAALWLLQKSIFSFFA